MAKHRSYWVEHWTTGKSSMVGGVRRSRSSRWATRQQAEDYAPVSVEINGKCGVHVEFAIHESKLPPQICPHCTVDRHPETYVCSDCWECSKVDAE